MATPSCASEIFTTSTSLSWLSACIATVAAADEVWLRSLFRLPERAADEIDAEREARRQEAAVRAEAMRRAMQRPPGNAERDDQGLDLFADSYAADEGDEEYRRRMERQWQRKMAAFLERQGRDVLRQAKRDVRS